MKKDIKGYRVDSRALAVKLAARIARYGAEIEKRGNGATVAEKRKLNKLRALRLTLDN